MVGKGVFLTRKETRARLGRIEVGGGEYAKWMGQQTKKSVGHQIIDLILVNKLLSCQ